MQSQRWMKQHRSSEAMVQEGGLASRDSLEAAAKPKSTDSFLSWLHSHYSKEQELACQCCSGSHKKVPGH